MTDPSTGVFVYVTYIATTRDKAWAALTEPEFTRIFWNGRILDTDWQAGSPITIRHDYDDTLDGTGTVLVADRPRRLSYSTVNAEGREATVTFELTANGDVVALTVTHTGLTDASAMRSASGGWSFILANLKTLLETGEPLPMPDQVLAAYR